MQTGFCSYRTKIVTFLLCGGLIFGQSTAYAQENVQIERKGPPLVNQAGYNLNEAKRVVVPGAADGVVFEVRRYEEPAPGQVEPCVGEVVYEGKIQDYAGDFSSFNPDEPGQLYVITVPGHGRSYPFRVADHFMEALSSRLAYQFFIDVRGGTDVATFDPTSVAGGGPSRDGGAYTLETPFEVLLFASNPALFDRWTEEMAPTDVPDLIDLILWHGAFAYDFRDYNGPTGHRPYFLGYEGEQLRTYDYQNTLDHIAAVLAAYHSFLKPYLPEETYNKYREVALRLWEPYDRHKVVRYWVKSSKSIDEGWQEFNEMGNALGQSVLRNLFMYQAEQHEPDGDPERFLAYAREATRDLIANWHFDNPRHTWLHRNGEHVGPQALAYFLMVAPDDAPPGTREKLESWRDYIVERTNNLWHYRTHSDTEWAHPQSKEVGTVAGLGGAMFAVAHVLDDPELRALGWSQVNFVFGLNPVGAHLSNKSAERVETGGYWPGIERGWPDALPDGAGKLGMVRGTLDGSPLNHAFPYNPEGYAGVDADRYYATEGWAVTNRAWMSTVIFSTPGSHDVSLFDPANHSRRTTAAPGDSVLIRLKAALNRSHEKVETGWVDVLVRSSNNPGISQRVKVKETGPDTGVFEASIHIVPRGQQGPGRLAAAAGDEVVVSYGYLGFEKTALLTVQ